MSYGLSELYDGFLPSDLPHKITFDIKDWRRGVPNPFFTVSSALLYPYMLRSEIDDWLTINGGEWLAGISFENFETVLRFYFADERNAIQFKLRWSSGVIDGTA